MSAVTSQLLRPNVQIAALAHTRDKNKTARLLSQTGGHVAIRFVGGTAPEALAFKNLQIQACG
jgi:hypothetical protein